MLWKPYRVHLTMGNRVRQAWGAFVSWPGKRPHLHLLFAARLPALFVSSDTNDLSPLHLVFYQEQWRLWIRIASLFVLLGPAQSLKPGPNTVYKLTALGGKLCGAETIFRIYSGPRVNRETDTKVLTAGLFSQNLAFFTMTYSDFKFTLCLNIIKSSCRV